jgi:hypothetical protein
LVIAQHEQADRIFMQRRPQGERPQGERPDLHAADRVERYRYCGDLARPLLLVEDA